MEDSSPLLAAIVQSSDDAIVSKTLEGIITSWNPAAERLFGYTAQEAIGRPITMLLPPDRADEEPRILARIAGGRSVDHFETIRVRKDGSLVPVSVTISPVRDADGRVVGASKIVRDISERQRANAGLQAQLARLQMLDQVTRAIGAHQDVRSIFQVTLRSIEERMPLDFACMLALDPDQRQLVVQHVGVHSVSVAMELALTEQGRLSIEANGLGRCVEGGLVYEPDTGALTLPFPRRLARGGLRSVVMSPLHTGDEVVGILVAARREAAAFSGNDCEFLLQLGAHVSLAARQAQLRARLERAYNDLRASQRFMLRDERLRALGQMASGIAHDVSNLIFPAVAIARELLATERLSDRGRESLGIVVHALDDVAATVHRLREFSRPREVQRPLVPVSLNPLVRNVIALAGPLFSNLAANGVHIDVKEDLSEDVPTVMGSEAELRDALLNLVVNALDAMPNGGVLRLATATRRADGDGAGKPFAELSVQDNGVGMDEETKRRCMDPFYTTKGERGTGLGLAMVYASIQRHGAEMAIDSTPNRGTDVRLRFPPAGVELAAPAVEAAAPIALAARRALRILVVDDDPLVLETLQTMLGASGHSTFLAAGGRPGVDTFAREFEAGNCFDLVITDLGMPEVDGYQVAQSVKDLCGATPVLLLTGWGEGWSSGATRPATIDHVMSKPPRLHELRDTVARLAWGGR